MHHDLIAELAGYRNELANTPGDQAGAVRAELERVAGTIRAKADRLDQAAAEHEGNGQDVLAAEARVEARLLRNALDSTPTVSRPAAAAEQAVPPAKDTASRGRRTAKG